MSKSNNPWLVHLAEVRKENPKVKDVKALCKLAKTTYKK
jgi:hypothetical protein